MKPILSLVLSSFLAVVTLAETSNQDTKAQTSTKNTSSAPLYGGELFSHDTVLFGRFTIRMKMVSEPGVVSSFFTYDNQSWQGNGIPWREIDFETIGRNPDALQSNLITGVASSRVHSEKITAVKDIEKYHTYVLEWTPDAIVWLVDGKEIRRDTAEKSEQVRDMSDTPQTYRSNIWVSEVIEWVGRFDEASLPLYQVIDFIKYETLEADNSYKFAWQDDFNTFDDKRWGKGNWGFETNLVTFDPKNIQVIDGELVMALTLGDKGIDSEHYLAQR